MTLNEMSQDFRPVIKEMLAEKDAEIERLKAKDDKWVKESYKTMVEIERLKALITELADALEEEFGESRDLMQSQQPPWNLIQRAREATR